MKGSFSRTESESGTQSVPSGEHFEKNEVETPLNCVFGHFFFK